METNTNIAGCGGVMRDASGHWKAGYVHNIGICSPLQAESWALLKGLQLATTHAARKVIFESDSSEVVRRMNNSHVDATDSNIILACKHECRRFEEVKILLIAREKNAVADFLAKLAKQYAQGVHILTTPPVEVARLLEEDATGIPQWRFSVKTR
ncbi:uncharacterized protein LOC116012358 [Ipomoea triloba]|uniref:uncharacterized protein LOC116012358 n=1 Tax=Ipomoea triloba TaxID=35885 RepID=UPI00125D504C|nr:uncharacterized protein LOC116012358 [Ipomoea triloba]